VNACMDCDDKGQCLTASWEAAFQRALEGSANNALKGSVGAKPSEDGMKREPSFSSDRSQFAADSDVKKCIGSTLENTEETNQYSMGTSCTRCHKMTIAMYLHPTTKQLVCKKCLR
jgi:formylmethanofuran dehydrogenase subunit E